MKKPSRAQWSALIDVARRTDEGRLAWAAGPSGTRLSLVRQHWIEIVPSSFAGSGYRITALGREALAAAEAAYRPKAR